MLQFPLQNKLPDSQQADDSQKQDGAGQKAAPKPP